MFPTLAGCRHAYEKIIEILPETPLLPLNISGVRCWAKAESKQPVGAFKIRGAWHRLTELSPAQRVAGVVAFSSGNHAQGIAWAAQRLGISAAIVMPSDAPEGKRAGTAALGAEIHLYDRRSESREAIAAQLAAERGAVLVPSFDDPWIVEGQGSAGIAIAEKLASSPARIITPCGGGGLAAGLALACPDADIVTVEPVGWDDMAQSLAGRAIVPVGASPPTTRCDALMTQRVADLTFGILHARGATGVAVSEDAIVKAQRYAAHALDLVVEPGGAVALAALLTGVVVPRDGDVVILSGGNIDTADYAALMANANGSL